MSSLPLNLPPIEGDFAKNPFYYASIIFQNVPCFCFGIWNLDFGAYFSVQLWQQEAKYRGTLQNVTREGFFFRGRPPSKSPSGGGRLCEEAFLLCESYFRMFYVFVLDFGI